MAKVRFSAFEFDDEALELCLNGQRVPLPMKPALLLKILLDRAPNVVSRSEAQRFLWPDELHRDVDMGLNACVRQLRTALGDNAASSRFVETRPKLGYRFIAEIDNAASSSAVNPEPDTSLQRAAGIKWRSKSFAAIGALALIALAAVLWPGVVQTGDRYVSIDEGNGAAREFLMKGRTLLKRGGADNLRKALPYFEQAALADPGSAVALSGKALAILRLAGSENYPRRQSYEVALRYANAADEIAPSPEAHEVRGYYALYGELKFDKAIKAFENAVALNPQYPSAYIGLASALVAQGDTATAAEMAARAAEIDPVSFTTRSDQCWFFYVDKRAEKAVEACRWAIELDGPMPYADLVLALMLDEAAVRERHMQNFLAANDIAVRGDAFASGYLQCAVAQSAEGRLKAYAVATMYSLCGDAVAAADWLQRSITDGDRAVLFAAADPRFDRVRPSIPDRQAIINAMRQSRSSS
ncbi:MAG: winged helix-turn-helix domain-containing protein [Pseudomonadota bacterium]